MSESITAFFEQLPAEWTEDTERALTVAVREALKTTRTLKGQFVCKTEQQALAGHWSTVVQRLIEANADVIHTGGTAWDRKSVV